MSLVQAREIFWNDILNIVKSVWQFLVIIEEEKNIVRYLQEVILSNNFFLQNRAQLAKRLIDFLNSKSAQEMKDFGIEDRTKHVMEIRKMKLKNANKKAIEKKLMEIKEAMMSFDINFDKRTRAGFRYFWDHQNNLLS